MYEFVSIFKIFLYLFVLFVCVDFCPHKLFNSLKKLSFFHHQVNRYVIHKIYTVNFCYFSIEKETNTKNHHP